MKQPKCKIASYIQADTADLLEKHYKEQGYTNRSDFVDDNHSQNPVFDSYSIPVQTRTGGIERIPKDSRFPMGIPIPAKG